MRAELPFLFHFVFHVCLFVGFRILSSFPSINKQHRQAVYAHRATHHQTRPQNIKQHHSKTHKAQRDGAQQHSKTPPHPSHNQHKTTQTTQTPSHTQPHDKPPHTQIMFLTTLTACPSHSSSVLHVCLFCFRAGSRTKNCLGSSLILYRQL